MTLSWWGPGTFPRRYEAGKRQIQEEFWANVIEWKYTLSDSDFVYNHPELRAQDLMDWFANLEVDAIISTIGWDESIRMLPYIDFGIIKNNPKIFLWYSDSTVTHFICQKAWLVSFYGPSIMAGFGENTWMFPYMIDFVKKTIFSNNTIWLIKPNMDGRTSELLNRSNPDNQQIKRTLQKSTWWRWIQWNSVVQGTLRGWCIDVLPCIIWTSIWPSLEERKNAILVLEPSEEHITTIHFERILRNLGSQGILDVISGIIVWRAQRDDVSWEQVNYDDTLIKIVANEFNRPDLPIVTNMDFGHTDPMMVLPLGCLAQLDCTKQEFSILENACV